MNEAKKHIKLLTGFVLIVAIVIIGGAGAFLHKKYQDRTNEKEALEKELSALVYSQKKALDIAVKEINVLKTKVELKDQEKEKKLGTLESNVADLQRETVSINDVVVQWRPITVKVSCHFFYTNGKPSAVIKGSGIIIETVSGIEVITNKHIVSKDNKYTPDFCRINVPGINESLIAKIDEGEIYWGETADVGKLKISQPHSHIVNLTENYKAPLCSNKAKIGDKIIVIGYPKIGSSTDITVTDGIISGYENNYYITSAKIESGNSGGGAILQDKNCYLGIPTFAMIGDAESLGRILDVKSIFKSI